MLLWKGRESQQQDVCVGWMGSGWGRGWTGKQQRGDQGPALRRDPRQRPAKTTIAGFLGGLGLDADGRKTRTARRPHRHHSLRVDALLSRATERGATSHRPPPRLGPCRPTAAVNYRSEVAADASAIRAAANRIRDGARWWADQGGSCCCCCCCFLDPPGSSEIQPPARRPRPALCAPNPPSGCSRLIACALSCSSAFLLLSRWVAGNRTPVTEDDPEDEVDAAASTPRC